MARKAITNEIVKHDTDMGALEKGAATVMENSASAQFFLDKAELMQQVGRIQGIDFTRRVGDVAVAKIFEEIKLSKKYKDLPYLDESGTTRLSGSLDEFCRAYLGKSYNRCLELSQNLNLLGEELYESTQKIGFRARDYAALRALPPASHLEGRDAAPRVAFYAAVRNLNTKTL